MILSEMDNFFSKTIDLEKKFRFASEIKEVDINPLLATSKGIIAVDARILLQK